MTFVRALRVLALLRGARYPADTIWLYGTEDPFYPLSHSQDNFAAFQKAGGKGAFHTIQRPPDLVSGHRIVERPGVWSALIEEYLKRQGLPSPER